MAYYKVLDFLLSTPTRTALEPSQLHMPSGLPYVCMYIYIYTYITLHPSIQPSAQPAIHTCIHLHICIYIYVPTHVYLSLQMYVYIRMHIMHTSCIYCLPSFAKCYSAVHYGQGHGKQPSRERPEATCAIVGSFHKRVQSVWLLEAMLKTPERWSYWAVDKL